MADLKRAIIILMAIACVINIIGVIYGHVNLPHTVSWNGFQMSYSVVFSVLLSLTGFLLIEQLLITDGTLAPLNRLRILYAFIAAVILILFGIITAIEASTKYRDDHRHNAVIAAVIAFIDAAVYIAEAIARNRKSRIV